MTSRYELNHIEQRLAEDDRTAELGIHLTEREGRLYLHGTVASQARRDRVLEVVHEVSPQHEVICEIDVLEDDLRGPPGRPEVIS